MGDGLLALFGALEANPWQARDAVLAALDMRAELARYNAILREQGLPELRFGIGIHGGEVVAGVIGTAGLSKFSVTGDPINVASRVEGLTSKMQVDLLITEDIRRVARRPGSAAADAADDGQGQGRSRSRPTASRFLTNAGAATSPPGARSNGLRKSLAAVRRIVNAFGAVTCKCTPGYRRGRARCSLGWGRASIFIRCGRAARSSSAA